MRIQELHKREYNKWCRMFHRQEGRVVVCDRWKSFDAFFSDMGDCPWGLWLCRYDRSRPYEPKNCFWGRVHTGGSVYAKPLTLNGETLSRTAWSKRTGIQLTVISGRLSKGWSVEDTLTTPSGKRSSKAIKLNSSGVESLRIARAGGTPIKELAKRFHLSHSSVRRISSGELFAYMEGPICAQDAVI